jgi:hypothetical protein
LKFFYLNFDIKNKKAQNYKISLVNGLENGKKKKNEADDLMTRDNFSKGLEFGDMLKDLGCELKKEDGIQNTPELIVRYKERNISRIAPRNGCWCASYRFWHNEKTVRVSSEKELNDLFDSFKTHIEELDTTKSNGKTKKKSKEEKPRTIDSIKRQLDKIGNSKGMKIPKGIMPDNEEFVKAVEDRGLILDWENRLVAKAKVSK